MPRLIDRPTRIEAAGNKPKLIDEYIGRVNSGDSKLSIAHMRSPGGWVEPGQTPEFDEFTIVLRGLLRVTSHDGVLDVRAGQAIVVRGGEWVQYSTPETDGAEYLAVCVPAFSLDTVHRDATLKQSAAGERLADGNASPFQQIGGTTISASSLRSGESHHDETDRTARDVGWPGGGDRGRRVAAGRERGGRTG